MEILLCEEHYAGFLTAVYHSFYTYKTASCIASDPQTVTLLDVAIHIDTDLELAQKVRNGLLKAYGPVAYDEIAEAYLNSAPGKEQTVYRYLRLLLAEGKKVRFQYAREEVLAFQDLGRQVGHECNRLTGFIRLQEMDNGIYYGGFTADHDIIERILPHFTARFNTQRLVLHDQKRRKMIYYDGAVCHYALAPDGLGVVLSDNETVFRALWKSYFQNVSIEERKNAKVQRAFLPKKYRHFMNEFLGNSEPPL